MIRARVIATGSYVPPKVLTNADLEKIVDTSDEWITSRSGIRERRIVERDVATSDLATQAALKALEMAGLSAEELDFIITGTNSPDMFFPCTSCFSSPKSGPRKRRVLISWPAAPALSIPFPWRTSSSKRTPSAR